MNIAGPEDSIYYWPLSNPLHDGVILVNYVDHNWISGNIADYMGFSHTYDGHAGTDLTLYSFRMMDRGIPVLAGADGTVTSVVDGNFDRYTYMSSAPANVVIVTRPAGTGSALYYHLRKNSTAVQVGEIVQHGQMLGLVGSSGSSTDAHLHFEVHGNPTLRDPFADPLVSPSMWVSQEPYVGHCLSISMTWASTRTRSSFPIC
jgi:murein DD-endopeptidase MepM/ murein hydrolase activator NlpD